MSYASEPQATVGQDYVCQESMLDNKFTCYLCRHLESGVIWSVWILSGANHPLLGSKQCAFISFERCHYVVQASLKLLILLAQFPHCWGYCCVPPHLVCHSVLSHCGSAMCGSRWLAAVLWG